MDDSLLPGAAPVPPPRRRGGPSIWPIALIGLLVAAVVGLLVGAVWGLSGGGNSGAAGPAATTSATAGEPSTTPPDEPSPTTPTSPTTPESSDPPPDELVPGEYPPAPPQSEQTSKRWRVGPWQITNTGGTIGMDATINNEAGKTRSGDFVLYLYVAGEPLARLTAAASDVPANSSAPITFTSTDSWGPGTKTLLLVAS